MSIRIVVAGASGKMGQEVVKMITQYDQFTLVGGVSRSREGQDIGDAVGIESLHVPFSKSVFEVIAKTRPDVLVDFTSAQNVRENIDVAIEAGVRLVVGTTGLKDGDIHQIKGMCEEREIGAIIAPNFAIGAVLMMKFASYAAKYLPHIEIIESHHDQKVDSPSGTALKTAEMITKNRTELKQGHSKEQELLEGARGAYVQGFRIHSVRLPGLIAHQEILFGGNGELLTVRHDTFDRESFMPGVKLAIQKVMDLNFLVYGMENIIDLGENSENCFDRS